MRIRNTVYFCLLHIYNKRSMFLVSFLFMLVGIIVFFDTFCIYLFSVSDIIKEREVLKDARENLYKMESDYISMDFEYYERYRDFLIEQGDTYNIGIYDVTNDLFSENFDEDTILEMKSCFPDMLSSDFGGDILFPVLKIDNSLLNVVDIKNEKQKRVELCIHEDGVIEIAIGAGLQKWITVGDELVSDITGKKYIVKEVLADDARWVSGSLLDNVQISSLDHTVLMPLELEDYESYECMVFVNNVYLCVNEDFDTRRSISDIIDMAEKKNIYIDICSMKEAEQSSLKNNNEEFRFSLLLVIIMIIAVAVILIILSVLGWVADSHDIGILYANGFASKDILCVICVENIMKLLMASGFSYVWIVITERNNMLQANYANVVYGFIVILFLCVIAIASVISFVLINRLSPSNLLKGEEI